MKSFKARRRERRQWRINNQHRPNVNLIMPMYPIGGEEPDDTPPQPPARECGLTENR